MRCAVVDLAGYDWAVCRLYNPLGSWLGYFGYNGYSDSWDNQPYWSIIGYPGAIANAERPSFQGGINVNDTVYHGHRAHEKRGRAIG